MLPKSGTDLADASSNPDCPKAGTDRADCYAGTGAGADSIGYAGTGADMIGYAATDMIGYAATDMIGYAATGIDVIGYAGTGCAGTGADSIRYAATRLSSSGTQATAAKPTAPVPNQMLFCAALCECIAAIYVCSAAIHADIDAVDGCNEVIYGGRAALERAGCGRAANRASTRPNQPQFDSFLRCRSWSHFCHLWRRCCR
eukprot:1353901-Rhodomonas_salina.1